jgi:hypothetical protein
MPEAFDVTCRANADEADASIAAPRDTVSTIHTGREMSPLRRATGRTWRVARRRPRDGGVPWYVLHRNTQEGQWVGEAGQSPALVRNRG